MNAQMFILILFVTFISGCSTVLTKEAQAIKQIESADGCQNLGETTQEDKIWGDFKEVKNRIRMEASQRGGNSFAIDSVHGSSKVTTAIIYRCQN